MSRWEKPPERWRVGTEHEKIGIYADGWGQVPFEGERGIGALLERVAEADDWTPVREGDHVIALEKGGASITLEPGGQLELSGAPLRTIHETCDEFHAHLALMKRVSEPLGIVWLGLGRNPIHSVDEIPRMPKERYDIMRRILPARGQLALEMMYATATVQANFDYADEADMVTKMRVATGVSPVVSAIFANSSLSERKPNGFISRRLHTWEHTDPDRTGMLSSVFEPDFGYRRYIEWALDVPMFFILRGGRHHPADGKTFREFLRVGHKDHQLLKVFRPAIGLKEPAKNGNIFEIGDSVLIRGARVFHNSPDHDCLPVPNQDIGGRLSTNLVERDDSAA